MITSALSRSIDEVRAEFRAEARERDAGRRGWTLVPAAVIDAMADALRFSMANVHGEFAASERSTRTIEAARSAIADLLGGTPGGVVLGPNMTTLTFHLADALSAGWGPGTTTQLELMHRFGLRDSGGAIRASIALYNDRDDVDRLLEAVADVIK